MSLQGLRIRPRSGIQVLMIQNTTRLNQSTHIAWSPAAVTAIFPQLKQTLTPPNEKTERGVGHMQQARFGDHSRTMPLKHGGHCVRALRCHQGNKIPLPCPLEFRIRNSVIIYIFNSCIGHVITTLSF